jgi:hypothetical protein
MAYTTINKPSDYFNIKTYTGNGSAGHSITGVGFQPDFVWTKRRDAASGHHLHNAISGATKYIFSNDAAAESTDANKLSSFNSDGFTVGTNGDANASGGGFVSWNWLGANTTASNTNGSTTSTVSVNTTSGFSIVKYTGTSAVATIGHGLGVIPKMIIVKNLSSGSRDWRVWHQNLTSASKYLILSSSATEGNDIATWNNTLPTNLVFSSAGSGEVNQSGNEFIAYCFAEKQGYSKCGQYIGTGYATGNFIYTGFRPKYILSKKITGTGSWNIVDADRLGYNRSNERMYANNTAGDGGDLVCDIYSNGFSWYDDGGDMNTAGDKYMYYAVAEAPLVGTNNVPCTAR